LRISRSASGCANHVVGSVEDRTLGGVDHHVAAADTGGRHQAGFAAEGASPALCQRGGIP